MNTSKTHLYFALALPFFLMEFYFYSFKTQLFFLYSPWFIFLFLTALTLKRCKLFLRDWLVFLFQLYLFNFLRGIIAFIRDYYQWPVYSDYIIKFEHLFTPGNSLANHLQMYLTTPFSVNGLEAFLAFIYSFHFVYFFMVAFIIWHLKGEQFWRFKGALVSCAFLGLLCYLIVPTMPPWMASEQHLIPMVRNIFQAILAVKFKVVIQAFDTNPVAAMPSLHVAFPSLCLLAFYYHFGFKKSWVLGVYLCIVIFATLLLGAHFIGDIIAGLLLSLVCFYVFYIKLEDRASYSLTIKSGELGLEIAKALLYMVGIVLTMFVLTQMKNGF